MFGAKTKEKWKNSCNYTNSSLCVKFLKGRGSKQAERKQVQLYSRKNGERLAFLYCLVGMVTSIGARHSSSRDLSKCDVKRRHVREL